MTTLADVQADFANYQNDVSAALQGLKDQVTTLQAKVDGGSAAESADFDVLKKSIDDADAALKPAPAAPGVIETPPTP